MAAQASPGESGPPGHAPNSLALPSSSDQQASPPGSPPRSGPADVDLSVDRRTKAELRTWLRGEIREFLAQALPRKRRQEAARRSRGSPRPPPSGSGERDRGSRSPPRPKRRRTAEPHRAREPTKKEQGDSGNRGSSSRQEEGELSEEEEPPGTTPRHDRLFPQDVFHKILPKVLRILELPVSSREVETADPKRPSNSARAFPRAGPIGVPFPAGFYQAVRAEWESPARPKPNHPLVAKFYSLVPEAAAERFRLPSVDDPVARLCPTSGGLPRDPCDRRIEQALRKDFEASSASLRASSASSLFARAVYGWASDLSAAESDVPKALKDDLKKIALAAAFSADASFDAIQLSARAMASSVAARRNVWLRSWDVDPAAQATVASVPFKGIRLFGEGMGRYLVEDEDQRKALPSRKRGNKPKKRFR